MMDIAARVNFLFKTMKTGLLPVPSSSRFLTFCTSMLLLVGFARGQSASRPVVLRPDDSNRLTSVQNALDSEHSPVSHKSRPLRVDVDLVLLPVTVSDPMN